MSFDSLPEETILKIAKHSAAANSFDANFYGCSRPTSGLCDIKSDYYGLQALASTSKQLRRICIPIWVSRITVHSREASSKESMVAMEKMLRERAHLAFHVVQLSMPDEVFVPPGVDDLARVLDALPNLRTLFNLYFLRWEYVPVLNSHRSLNTVHFRIIFGSPEALASFDDSTDLSRLVKRQCATVNPECSAWLSRGMRLKKFITYNVSDAISTFRSFPTICLTELGVYWKKVVVGDDWDGLAHVARSIPTLRRISFIAGHPFFQDQCRDAYASLSFVNGLAAFLSQTTNIDPVPFLIRDYAIERECSDILPQGYSTPWSSWRLRALNIICYGSRITPASWIAWLGAHGEDITSLSLHNSDPDAADHLTNMDDLISDAWRLPHLESLELEGLITRVPDGQDSPEDSRYLCSIAERLKESFPSLELVFLRSRRVTGTVQVRRRLLVDGGGIETHRLICD